MSCNEWKIHKLKDVCTKIGSGSTPRGGSNVYKDEGITLIRSQNVYNNSFDYSGLVFIDDEAAQKLKNVELKENDILLNITGDSVARCTIVPQKLLPARVNQHVCILRVNDKIIHPFYLKSFLVNSRMQEIMLSLAQSGGTRAALTKGMIENFEIPIPSLEEQEKIANILSSLDDNIELNNEMNKTLEEMAQAIFKRWFVDFEFPNEDGKPYKSSGGKMVESELGMIPKGWEVKCLEDITSVISKGTTPTKKDIDASSDFPSIKFLKVKDIDENGNIITDNLEYIPLSVHNNKLKRSILYTDDIVFSIAGTIGRVSVIDDRFNNSNMNQALAFIRLSDKDKMFIFTLYLMKSSTIQQKIKSNIVQAVQANVSLGTLKALKFSCPNDTLLNMYNNIVKPIYNKQICIKKENESLKSIRDTLLPKLMSGEVRVE